jgi:hypothetical protein
MICDRLPIVGGLLSESLKSRPKYSNREKNFCADYDRPFNRQARRAGTGKQSADSLFSGWSI